MKYQAFRKAAAALLSTAAIGCAFAQSTAPRTDTAPPPAEDRSSMGAVILMDQPVLAQREAMQQNLASAPDTRSMGAGPARLLRGILTRDEQGNERALDAADIQTDGGKARTPK
jgi:hypothetical protein